jgi:hypothetical protein
MYCGVVERASVSGELPKPASLVIDSIEIGYSATGVQVIGPGITFIFSNDKAKLLISLRDRFFLWLFSMLPYLKRCLLHIMLCAGFICHPHFPPLNNLIVRSIEKSI